MGNISWLNEHILVSKVDDAFAVWFGTSRKFMMMEEPAFFVLKQIIKNKPFEEISLKCFHRYKNPVENCREFVSGVEQNTAPYRNFVDNDFAEEEIQSRSFKITSSFYSEFNYVFGDLEVKIKYGDSYLENVIHPLIQHFVSKMAGNKYHQFNIFRYDEKLIFNFDGVNIENLGANETGYLKASVLLKLMELIYGIDKNNWMMTLHAAAVTDGKRAMVFPARAGSGKSTLAALLNAHQFKALSDDFIAVNVSDKCIYTLPVAATIKSGSMNVLTPFYPELNQISAEKAYTGKEIRYLPLNDSVVIKKGYLAVSFMFVRYQKDHPGSLIRMDKKQALKLLLEETWINPNALSVTEFFKWFHKTKFYEFTYSDTLDALNVVKRLFKQ